MSPSYFSCIICGGIVQHGDRDSRASWLAEYRAIFSSPPDHQKPKMSGVGLNHNPSDSYIVPPSNDARWDDEGYQFPDTDAMSMMSESLYDESRHGFILHDMCHSLLKDFFHPRGVPMARLWEICNSLPFRYRGVSWGHDYGGLASLQHLYPWEGQDINDRSYAQPKLGLQHRADPWNTPELLRELLEGTQVDMPKKEIVNSIKLSQIDGAVPNCLTRLPLEIIGHIVTYLPTDDVRTLGRASKELLMIVPSGLGQSFWASRFRPPFELNFAFETHKYRDKLDWRSLYLGVVKAVRCSSGLQNRERIWGLIRSPLSELVNMHWCGSSTSLPLDTGGNQLRWKEVRGDLMPPKEIIRNSDGLQGSVLPLPPTFEEGCNRFHIQRTFIPTLLRQVVISTILIGNASYVTRLQLIPTNGPAVDLGYRAEGKQLSSNTADQFMDITGMRGFILAMGSKGIQALQFITCDGQLSPWFGRPDGVPKTRRLATSESIAALEAGFDGFKMVSLAIATSHPYVDGLVDEAESIRDRAIWFPEIPESHLLLNETFFTGINTSGSEFQPLSYILFGGSSVTNIQHLTKISMLYTHGVEAIDFHYDTSNIRRLGRQRYQLSEYDTSYFLIDGVGGEIVDSIEVDLNTSYAGPLYKYKKSIVKHGILQSIKISTNRGRYKCFQPKRCPLERTYRKLMVVPGTTPTGIYAGWDSWKGLVSLGVISEPVKELLEPSATT